MYWTKYFNKEAWMKEPVFMWRRLWNFQQKNWDCNIDSTVWFADASLDPFLTVQISLLIVNKDLRSNSSTSGTNKNLCQCIKNSVRWFLRCSMQISFYPVELTTRNQLVITFANFVFKMRLLTHLDRYRHLTKCESNRFSFNGITNW